MTEAGHGFVRVLFICLGEFEIFFSCLHKTAQRADTTEIVGKVRVILKELFDFIFIGVISLDAHIA